MTKLFWAVILLLNYFKGLPILLELIPEYAFEIWVAISFVGIGFVSSSFKSRVSYINNRASTKEIVNKRANVSYHSKTNAEREAMKNWLER